MARSGPRHLSVKPGGGASRPLTAGLAGLAAVCAMVALGTGEAAAPASAAGAAGTRAPAAAVTTASALTWGDNSAGELGDGTLTGSKVPAGVAGLSAVRAIAAGGRHDLALLSVGELTERVGLLKDEIARLEAEMNRKQASKSAADLFFKR